MGLTQINATALFGLNPKFAGAYLLRGFTWKQMENYDNAIKLNPKYTKAYYNRGLMWMQMKNYDRGSVSKVNMSKFLLNGRFNETPIDNMTGKQYKLNLNHDGYAELISEYNEFDSSAIITKSYKQAFDLASQNGLQDN